MENNVITQLEERFERISQKADTCLQLKAIKSYHTERYKSADFGFVFRINIIAEGEPCGRLNPNAAKTGTTISTLSMPTTLSAILRSLSSVSWRTYGPRR